MSVPASSAARPRVTTAAQAAARDRAAIDAGTPSFDLMLRAGTSAARWILANCADRLSRGVAVYAGTGNNGGDAGVVGAQLARAGVVVRMHATSASNTDDAKRAAALAAPFAVHEPPHGDELLVIDGLLGTGHRGELREHVAIAAARIAKARDDGALVVALDIPSGLDATTGEFSDGGVVAHDTLTFGTLKRGLLLRRDVAGHIALLDIGLGPHAIGDDDAWEWAHRVSLAAALPPIAWNAHKARRGRVAIVGGMGGMAGAVVLAARGALAAGAGLVHGVVDAPSILPLQVAVPQAIAQRWPAPHDGEGRDTAEALPAMDALVVGPGLGRTKHAARLVEALLQLVEKVETAPSLVLDADALFLVAEVSAALGTDAAALLRHWTRSVADRGRAVVCTPHPREFERLLGAPLSNVWDERAHAARTFAARAGVTLLLKGTPTLVTDGVRVVAAPYGTAMLATGGSGDCLTGIIATMLAQGASALDAALLGAALHGRAAEIVTAERGGVRGASLDDVLDAMPIALRWLATAEPTGDVLAELPAVP